MFEPTNDLLSRFYYVLGLYPKLIEATRKAPKLAKNLSKATGKIGKLGLKYEAAGKIRVFAMVDAWTQWMMGPVHGMIFSILEKIPQDGTFNQTLPVEKLIEKFKDPKKGLSVYSIDLSAATDRLPIHLQKVVLQEIANVTLTGLSSRALKKVSRLWADILVRRDYYLTYPRGGEFETEKLRYAVGQPMGALSSWAMLAITHHALVQ